ncbi:MAG: flagellar hook-basal body protein [Lachnospiraceae bacterium]|jgi:flagellar basal-body rod protein FlgG|nr:flagellar hook-basal body protein [Lachnospiraceae bacterium]
MVKGLYAAYTGMVNQQHRMDVLTHNIANVNTNGYKKEGATSQAFNDVLTYKIKDSTENGRLVRHIGNNNPGVKIGETYTDFSQGSLRNTRSVYDLALSGPGFFTIEYTNKSGETTTKYTRDGNFTLNVNGELVTQDGDYVLDTNGRHIVLDTLTTDTVIDAQGNILQNGRLAAQVGVRDFENYDFLSHFGENFWQPVEGATFIPSTAQVYSSYLETANISVVSEMVNMIATQRAYDTNQKVISTIDGTLDIAANQIPKLG